MKHKADTIVIVNSIFEDRTENEIRNEYGTKVIFEYNPHLSKKEILHKCSCGIIFDKAKYLDRHLKFYAKKEVICH